MLSILKLFQFYNKKQLLKTREQHHILVGVMLTFAICITLFDITKYSQIIKFICYIRVIDIIIHNLAVAFFDKYKIENKEVKIIENITSYKRMCILNTLVLLELVLYTKQININLIFVALGPTIYLIFKCFDKYIGYILEEELKGV